MGRICKMHSKILCEEVRKYMVERVSGSNHEWGVLSMYTDMLEGIICVVQCQNPSCGGNSLKDIKILTW